MSYTIAHALQQANIHHIERIDAQLLLLHTLKRNSHDRAWLLAHDSYILTSNEQHTFQNLLQQRAQGLPIAYLTGKRAFYGLELAVDNRVLDPRADTETLVQWALELAPQLSPTPFIADMGTGSGAIACALAHHLPQATIWATDASQDALTVAQHNAQRLQLPIQFAQGNWFAAWQHAAKKPQLHLIVSNPPYIEANDPHLPALQHEPINALVSGSDGLDAIRTLTTQAPNWLAPQGWLLLEHGYNQAAAVRSLFEQNHFHHIQTRCDLAGIIRCTGGQFFVHNQPA